MFRRHFIQMPKTKKEKSSPEAAVSFVAVEY